MQTSLLLDMGLRVVAPDLMGFGGTDTPTVPPESLALYGLKRASDDIKELARQLGCSKIILGLVTCSSRRRSLANSDARFSGHDWGGFRKFDELVPKPGISDHRP